ncbi:MAG: peptidoglycan recognition family protein [Tepidisphaerales bacterium]
MLKTLGLLILAGMLAGCQEQEADNDAPRPNLAPPGYAQYPKPLPDSTRSTVYPGRTASPALRPYTYEKSTYEDRHVATNGVPRNWIPQAKLVGWKYVVVHHSDTKVGGAVSFDNGHRARGWECLGYDFVIGNGTYTRDGEIEVGQRWVRQMVGAHAGVEEFNKYGIGICLVGDFQNTRPSAAQLKSLAYLTGYLQRTYHIPANRVIGHRDCKVGHTLCPGRYMDMNLVRRMAAQYAGAEQLLMPDDSRLALNAELLHDVDADASEDLELLQDAVP